MMINRRSILGFLGSVGTASVLAKLSPVRAEPIPVSPKPIAGSGDVYLNIGKGSLYFKAEGSDVWESLGTVSDFEIVPDTTGQIDATYPAVLEDGGDCV